MPVGNGGTGATTLASNSILTGNGTSAIQAESGLTYNGSTLAVTGEIDVSDIIHANGNASNRLDLDDDSDSGQVNQVTLAGVNNVNIVIDQTNNGTGDFQVRARPTTASDLDTASMILDMDKVTAVFNQDTSQQFQIGSANRLKILEAGVQVQNSSLGVGVTPPSDNGIIQSSGAIICGDGDGDIALTTNDGGGNANITFNHTNQDPDNNGQSARIHVNVDATSSEANMIFETSSGDVTGGATDVTLVDSFKIAHDFIEVTYDIRHMGDTNTQLRFPSNDTIQLRTSGNTRININSSGEIQFNEAYTFPTSDGSNAQVLATNGSGNLFFTNALADPYGNLSEFANLNAGINDDGKTITFSQSSAQWILGPVPITTSGTTQNGLLTFNSASVASVESELTYNGGELKVNRSGSVTNKVTITGGSTAVLDLNSTGDSFIEKDTGNSLYLANNAQDKDIYFRVNDGGGNVNAIQIDASDNARVKLPNNNQRLSIGEGNDIQINHDGNNSYFDNYTGDLIIKNNADDAGIRLQCDDGSGGTTNYITCDGEFTSINLLQSTALSATKKLFFDGGNGTYVHELSDNVIEFRTDNNPQLKIDNSAGVIVNDGSYSSFDFRVESNNKTHMLFVDSGADRVGIGESSLDANLHITGSPVVLKMERPGVRALRMGTPDDSSDFVFADSDDLKTNQRMELTGGGDVHVVNNLGVGTASPGSNLQINSNTNGNTSILFLENTGLANSGNLRVGIPAGNGSYASGATLNDIVLRNERAGGSIIIGAQDSVQIGVAGSDNDTRMIVNSSGNVGIGTNSPGRSLQVNGDGVVRLVNDSGDAGIDFNSSDMQLRYRSASDKLQFYSYGTSTNVMTIQKSNGSVGIGTESPSYTLDVDGNIRATGDLRASDDIILDVNANYIYLRDASSGLTRAFGMNSSNNTYIGPIDSYAGGSILYGASSNVADHIFYTSGSERLRIKATTGNVGIGVTNPDSPLHIGNNVATDDGFDSFADYQILLYDTGTSSTSYGMGIRGNTFMFNSDDDFEWRRDNSAKMFLDGSEGRLGIGTTSPNGKLDLSAHTSTTSDGDGTATMTTSGQDSILLEGHAGGASGTNYGSICWLGGNRRRAMITSVADGSNDTDFIGLSFYTQGTDGSGDFFESFRLRHNGEAHFDKDVIAFSSTPSDVRLKENFEKIENGLDIVSQLDGHTFNWKKGGERLSAGFKAQEVEKILPHLVDEKTLPLKSNDEKEYKTLRYEELIPYLVEAIKEQQVQIEELKSKIGE